MLFCFVLIWFYFLCYSFFFLVLCWFASFYSFLSYAVLCSSVLFYSISRCIHLISFRQASEARSLVGRVERGGNVGGKVGGGR